MLLYEISNPIPHVSVKKTGDIHGYGLENVKECVNRNSGFTPFSRLVTADVVISAIRDILKLIDCSPLRSISITETSSLSGKGQTLRLFPPQRTERATFTAFRSRIYNA